ncbi:NAD(P)-dependent oxidoreductase [Peribacillus kribbensis]|uniref:NAD(P)-dependent oxidoreductase n=1 Tax=Peribacillus kribbensis TaxID=356658 RepID=UPI0004114A4E|nr:NAD(P)-dependent oxidoreductase [Peribacillus kribbensis]
MIGFIGLGIMGSRMAANLLKAGFEVTVYNRSKDKAEELLNKGAKWAESPKEAAEKSDVLFTMLANPSVVEAVSLGEEGFLDSLKEGKLWVDCSTVDPSFSRRMANESEKRHLRFLDAPVSGSKLPAENAELIFLVGGSGEDLEEVRPMMEAMGKSIVHQGSHGMGSSMKLVINLMLGQTMAVFAEAVSFGEAIGLERGTVVETLLGGITTAPFLKGKKNKVLEHDFAPEFPLEHLQKDLQLVSQTAFENNTAMPIVNVTKEIYALAKQQGWSKEDFSVIYRLFSEKK